MNNCNARSARHACWSIIGRISRMLFLALLVFASVWVLVPHTEVEKQVLSRSFRPK